MVFLLGIVVQSAHCIFGVLKVRHFDKSEIKVLKLLALGFSDDQHLLDFSEPDRMRKWVEMGLPDGLCILNPVG